MDPFEILKSEHDNIESMITSTERIFGKWHSDKDVFVRDMHKLIHFFKEFADEIHHTKEEEILFLELKKRHDFMPVELLDELSMQHGELGELIHEVEDHLSRGEFQKSEEVLAKYCEMLKTHIAIENDELFPMAEDLFNGQEAELIADRMKDVDMLDGERKLKLLEYVRMSIVS